MKHQGHKSRTRPRMNGTARHNWLLHYFQDGHHHSNSRSSERLRAATGFSWRDNGNDDGLVFHDMGACGFFDFDIFPRPINGPVYCNALHRFHHNALNHCSNFHFIHDCNSQVASTIFCLSLTHEVKSVRPITDQSRGHCHRLLHQILVLGTASLVGSHLERRASGTRPHRCSCFSKVWSATSALQCGNDCAGAGTFGGSRSVTTCKSQCPSILSTCSFYPLAWRSLY